MNFPDEGYYARRAPYLNPLVLLKQLEAGNEAMLQLVGLSFNQIAFFSLNLENFVNYDLLANGFPVYAADSMHRQRTPILRAALKELAECAHLLHVEFWLQIYELSFPDHVDGTRLTGDSDYTCFEHGRETGCRVIRG